MKILKKISLDFGKDTLPVTVFAKQNDAKTRFIEIKPINCGGEYTIEDGVIPRLQITKADGCTVINDVEIIDGIIVAELTPQVLAAAGIAVAEIALYKDDAIVSSQIFYIDVKESAITSDAPESSPEYNSFVEATVRAEKAIKKIDGMTVTAESGEDAAASVDTSGDAVQLRLTLPKGDPGNTPKRGKDYWTDADIAEIKAYVDDAILGGAW